ncbi:dephospho-CoA kinase [Romboutsia sp.]|uniref:dephospho-CoA kinase n=1 Tax=Romboutsia sp. TaxID=1965302 RepID=UPI002C8E620B|nr:dephospho-CoA kinase [Romboutsia sp.]HSQ89214.1 dephospho-CoA kinase [Romboutsia sp.]
MLILGLTGNIGCGKSSLSNIFKENDIEIIDADIISRQIFEDKILLEEVFIQFGEDIKNSDGSLDRKALGRIVFNNNNKLIELNNLTHPKIRNKILDKIETAKNYNKKIVVIDAALLIESGYLTIVHKLLVVNCNKEVQIKRIQDRDNCTKEEAISRINSQMSQKEKVKYADYIIDNSGTFEELREKANNFILYMKENWCE